LKVAENVAIQNQSLQWKKFLKIMELDIRNNIGKEIKEELFL